jgi:hypothetical protein
MNTPTACHDFKSPRPGAGARLPSAFLAVPALFYLAIVGGCYINVNCYINYRKAVTERDTWRQSKAEKDEAKAKFESQIAALDTETIKAEKLAQWIEGTRTIQPICVAITRCVPPEIALGDLNLERRTDMPSQLDLSVRINNGSMQEVARIQSAVQNIQYRTYNSQQLKNNDNLEYKTMLVWQPL